MRHLRNIFVPLNIMVGRYAHWVVAQGVLLGYNILIFDPLQNNLLINGYDDDLADQLQVCHS